MSSGLSTASLAKIAVRVRMKRRVVQARTDAVMAVCILLVLSWSGVKLVKQCHCLCMYTFIDGYKI